MRKSTWDSAAGWYSTSYAKYLNRFRQLCRTLYSSTCSSKTLIILLALWLDRVLSLLFVIPLTVS